MSTNVRILTPEGRVSFPSVFKPKAFKDQEPKYALTLLLPKNNKEVQVWMEKTKALCAEIAKEKWGSNIPKKLTSPFRDGDDEQYDGYEGMWFITARNSADRKPAVVRKLRSGATEPLREDEFYPGCYAVMSVVPFAYDTDMKKGISFSLQNVLKTRDGDAFGAAGRSADDDFADVAVTEDEATPAMEDNGLFG